MIRGPGGPGGDGILDGVLMFMMLAVAVGLIAGVTYVVRGFM